MVWYTWLGYFGLIFGLVASGVLGTPMLRSSLIGFAIGIVLVLIINVATPQAAPCLQNAKGWDVLRAHAFCR